MAALEPHKLDEIRARAELADDPSYHRKPFGREWDTAYWTKWAAISHALRALEIPVAASVLDIGVGSGWTTVFLAEEGYQATGTDIAPASVDIGQARARRYGVTATFEVSDMDDMALDRTFDVALVFDALHHSTRQAQVVQRMAEHLKPGGWALFGEPSWLHSISPHAIKTSRRTGWVERGVHVTRLKRDCRRAGLGDFRRFYEGTAPTSSLGGVACQMLRLALAPLACSPQTSIWLAAQKRAGSASQG